MILFPGKSYFHFRYNHLYKTQNSNMKRKYILVVFADEISVELEAARSQ